MKGLFMMDLQALKTQKKLLLILAALCVLYIVMQMYEFMLSFIPLFLAIIVLRISMSTAQQPALSRFLFTLPFSRKQYIAEKYLLAFGTSLAALTVIGVLMILFGDGVEPFNLMMSMGMIIACTVLLVSVYIPVSLRFRENAVLWLSIPAGVFAVAAVYLAEDFPKLVAQSAGWMADHQMLLVCGVLAILVLTLLISVAFSMRILKNEEF